MYKIISLYLCAFVGTTIIYKGSMGQQVPVTLLYIVLICHTSLSANLLAIPFNFLLC
jgi:hypothetical protein